MRGSRSNIATAVSFIIFIALLAIAARTYFDRDIIGVELSQYRAFWIEFPCGSIQLNLRTSTRAEEYQTGWKVLPPAYQPGVETVMGFGVFHHSHMFLRGESTPWFAMTVIVMPLCPWAGLAALLPVAWVRRAIKRRRPHNCPTCGYDLRATPGRCPECGAIAPS